MQHCYQNKCRYSLASLYFCCMKFFISLLTVYMLLLSCIPCSDSGNCTDKEGLTELISHAGDDEHNDVENICTPFCVCACCSVPVFQAANNISIAKYSLLPQLNFYMVENFISTSEGGIWQPPRV